MTNFAYTPEREALIERLGFTFLRHEYKSGRKRPQYLPDRLGFVVGGKDYTLDSPELAEANIRSPRALRWVRNQIALFAAIFSFPERGSS